jgi:hypothetical protein
MNAIVIGAENSHPDKCLFSSIPILFDSKSTDAPSYPPHAVEANRTTPSTPDPDPPHRREFRASAFEAHGEFRNERFRRLNFRHGL